MGTRPHKVIFIAAWMHLGERHACTTRLQDNHLSKTTVSELIHEFESNKEDIRIIRNVYTPWSNVWKQTEPGVFCMP